MQKLFAVLCLVCFFIAPVHAAEPVKKSTSGICHDADSQWYKRTKNFTAYKNMANCVAAGGEAYSGYNPHPVSTVQSGYSRALFPHWLDEDNNCRDTRAETLIKQSEVPVSFADIAQCQVKTGRWYDPYTGNTYTDDDDLDIDHVVPLKWAYEHGADTWTEYARAAFANDAINVIAVSLSANRSKGAKGPAEWMPANQGYRCQYLERFQSVTQKYRLEFSQQERRVLSRQLSACSIPG